MRQALRRDWELLKEVAPTVIGERSTRGLACFGASEANYGRALCLPWPVRPPHGLIATSARAFAGLETEELDLAGFAAEADLIEVDQEYVDAAGGADASLDFSGGDSGDDDAGFSFGIGGADNSE